MPTLTLRSPRFLSYLAATFLGAFNDNAFKLVVSMAALTLVSDAAAQQHYLSLTSALAILPFVLCSGYAGYLADRYRKSTVLRISKAAEILAMGAALLVFATGQNLTLLLITLFLLALHSAFFSPSKYSVLPEILAPQDLARANGYLNMLTFLAIIIGSVCGAMLWGSFKDQPTIIGLLLTGVAVLGTVLCWFVPQSPAGNAAKPFRLNPFHEIARGVALARRNRVLVVCMLGSACFWMLGALIYLALILLGKNVLKLSETASGSLFACLAIGIALGSVLAGNIMGKSNRYGLILWGALLLSLGCMAAGVAATSYATTAALMVLVGFGGGLFVVPVVTLLQRHAPDDQRGQILATTGFFDMLGVLAASGLFTLLGMAQLSPAMVIAAAGMLSFVGLLWALRLAPSLLPDAIESLIYVIARRIYRVRLVGAGLEEGSLPQPNGGAVFVANHVSYVDGLILSMLSRKRLRFMVLSTFWKKPVARYVLNAIGAIPFGTGEAGETQRGLDAARAALARGEYICIFPEGALTRTGHLLPFKRGVERLVEGLDVPIIALYLDRLWGSIFSFAGQKFIRKRPARLPYPVTVAVGLPLDASTPAWKLNRVVAALGSETVPHRYDTGASLGRRFIRAAKHRMRTPRMRDTTGRAMNGWQSLVAARLMAKALRRPLGDAARVGVMLPASVGGAAANLALALLGRTSVNLNFSLGEASLRGTIAQAELAQVITSRAVVERLGIAADQTPFLYLEDLLGSISRLARLLAALQAMLLPGWVLQRLWLRGDQSPDATATILFSSGSTGTPKAIMLGHRQLLANIDAIADLLAHAETDQPQMLRLAGVLPFFHSFGLTSGIWLPAITGRPVSYHMNPLEGKNVARMLAQDACGILVATPTFAKLYAGLTKTKGLPALRHVILGGEKLTESAQQEIQSIWTQANILQGYGATELGPVVAINVPDVTHGVITHRGRKDGSVGKLIPGVAARIIHPETGEELAPGEEGLILIRSAACMQGYLNDAARTQDVIQDGWYHTGDIGLLDKEGFLTITDRLARFSKIGGEMVPHGKIEEALGAHLPSEAELAVVAVEDAGKGEKLVVLSTDAGMDGRQLQTQLRGHGLPNLWIPAWEHFYVVEAIPTLANGKRDLKACKTIATERMGSSAKS